MITRILKRLSQRIRTLSPEQKEAMTDRGGAQRSGLCEGMALACLADPGPFSSQICSYRTRLQL